MRVFAGDEWRLVPRSDVFPGDWQQIAQHCEERTIKHLVERSLGRGRKEGVGIDVDGVIHQHEYQPLFTAITSRNTRGCAGAGSAFVKSDMSVTVDEADDIVVHWLKVIGGCNEQPGGIDRADQTPHWFSVYIVFEKVVKTRFLYFIPSCRGCFPVIFGVVAASHSTWDLRTACKAKWRSFRLEPGMSAGWY